MEQWRRNQDTAFAAKERRTRYTDTEIKESKEREKQIKGFGVNASTGEPNQKPNDEREDNKENIPMQSTATPTSQRNERISVLTY